MTILLTTLLILGILAGSVMALLGAGLLAERIWRHGAEADIIRRSEELLRQAAVGMA